MDNKYNRPEVTNEEVKLAFQTLRSKLKEARDYTGSHAFISTHEIVGVIQEEFDELKDAVHNNEPDSIVKELMDLLISALWSYISFTNEKCDW